MSVAQAGSDVQLAFSSLPTTQALSGSGSGGTAPYTFQWYILDTPSGSTATLSSDTVAAPTLNGIDTMGTYRMFLVVTDSLGAVSESDPLVAPDSAFVHVRVSSQYDHKAPTTQKLNIPAIGERDHGDQIQKWFIAVDNLQNDFDQHGIADHVDTTATGGELNTLTDGSNATGLHTHDGADVGVATPAAFGVVKLAEAALNPAEPFVVTKDRVYLSAGPFFGTLTASGFDPGIIEVPAPTGDESEALWFYRNKEAFTIDEVNVGFLDAGDTAGDYDVVIYEMTAAQFLANNFGAAATITTVTVPLGATANAPNAVTNTGIAYTTTADRYLVARVTGAPTTPGSGATISIHGFKAY